MELLYTLLILLLATRVLGEIATRVGQPPLVGELLAGIILGFLLSRYSGSFPILSGLPDDEVFKAITDLAIFFLMLLAGIEMRPSDIAESSTKAIFVALGGMALPFVAGFAAAWAFLPVSDYRIAQCIFVAVALSVTAVPVVVRVLRDVGQQDTPMGRVVISAAIFDDILSLILLAVLTAVVRTGSFPNVQTLMILVGKIVLFFAIALVFGRYVQPWAGRLIVRLKAEEFELSGLLVASMAYAVLAEWLDMHFIVGAFMAGVFFGRRTMGDEAYWDVRQRISGLTTGFLGPLFFASIGLHLDLSAFFQIPGFLAILLVLAFVSKLVGAGIPARMFDLGVRDSVGVGVAMSARGAVELIIAGIALRAGLFEHPDPTPEVVSNLFSAIVIVAIATTLATPIAMQMIYRLDRAEEGAESKGDKDDTSGIEL